jgi:hypothetical protein
MDLMLVSRRHLQMRLASLGMGRRFGAKPFLQESSGKIENFPLNDSPPCIVGDAHKATSGL